MRAEGLERQAADAPRHWTRASPTVERTRRQLVEEGFEAVLARKGTYSRLRPAAGFGRRRGGSENRRADPLSGPGRLCQMDACVCSRRRSSKLHIVERASRQHDRADARKNIAQAASQAAMGDSARRQCGVCRHHGRRPGSLSATARYRSDTALVCLRARSGLEAAESSRRARRVSRFKPGQPARDDLRIRTQWRRQSVRHGCSRRWTRWRHVKVTDRTPRIDYAHVLRDSSDTHFPDAAQNRAGAG